MTIQDDELSRIDRFIVSAMKQLYDMVSMDRFTENEAEGEIIREPDE